MSDTQKRGMGEARNQLTEEDLIAYAQRKGITLEEARARRDADLQMQAHENEVSKDVQALTGLTGDKAYFLSLFQQSAAGADLKDGKQLVAIANFAQRLRDFLGGDQRFLSQVTGWHEMKISRILTLANDIGPARMAVEEGYVRGLANYGIFRTLPKGQQYDMLETARALGQIITNDMILEAKANTAPPDGKKRWSDERDEDVEFWATRTWDGDRNPPGASQGAPDGIAR